MPPETHPHPPPPCPLTLRCRCCTAAARMRYLYILSGVGGLLAAAHLLPRLAPWLA
jgi:hypothetical protein